MAPRLQLDAVLSALPGVIEAYFQPDQNIKLVYPCITYSRSESFVARADNLVYRSLKRYDVTVIDRDPDSLIPDMVEALPYSRFDRKYVVNGLNHFSYQLFF